MGAASTGATKIVAAQTRNQISEQNKRTNDRGAVVVFHATDLVMVSAELFDELRWRITDACSEHLG